jgi:hypothetical protein
MGKVCSTNEGEEECIYVIMGRSEGKRSLGRPRCKWVDDIKMDF